MIINNGTMTVFEFHSISRYHYGRPPRPFYVLLKVGQREFIGDGPTRQAARHSAATKALKVLRSLPVPSESSKPKTEDQEESEGNRNRWESNVIINPDFCGGEDGWLC